MKLITGHTGEPHVYAVDDANINKITVGSGDYVFPYGNKFALTKTGTRTVSISDGYLMTQGRLAVIRPGNTETLTIPSTSTGYYKSFIIAAEYSVNASGIESMKLVVVAGSASQTAPSGSSLDPDLEDGDINNGETHQMALYRVVVRELEIYSTTKLYSLVTVMSKTEIRNNFTSLDNRLDGLAEHVDTIIPMIRQELNNELYDLLRDLDPFYYEKGETFSIGNNRVTCAGGIANSSTRLFFTIPTKPMGAGTIKINRLNLTVRLSTGGYPYVKTSQSQGLNVRYRLNDANVPPQANTREGVKAISAVKIDGGIRIIIDFSSKLLRPDGKTAVLNNTPVTVSALGEFTLQ